MVNATALGIGSLIALIVSLIISMAIIYIVTRFFGVNKDAGIASVTSMSETYICCKRSIFPCY